MPIVTEQPTFSSGEVSTDVQARYDVAKWRSALRMARNAFVLPQGGVKRRPGTDHVGRTRNNQHRSRLIPFQFSTSQGYALEFTYQTMRVVMNGAYITTTPVAFDSVFRLAPVGVTTIHAAAHGLTAGQEVYLAGAGGLNVGGLSQVNLRTFAVGAVTADTFTILDRDGDDIDSSGWTPYTSGGTAAGIYEIATPYFDSELADIRYEQSADVMYLAHPNRPPQKLSRLGHANWTMVAADFGTQVATPLAPDVVAVSPNTEDFVSKGFSYVVSAINDTTGQESQPTGKFSCDNDLTLLGNHNLITWTASVSAGVTRYMVYKGFEGIFGYIGSTDPTTLSFTDDNIDPDFSQGPATALNPFIGAGNYPSALGFYEQRLFFGGTTNRPNGMWGSRTSDFLNFDYHTPQRADDGVSFGISARQLNRVEHIVPMSDLLPLTSDTVFKVNGPAGYIAPNSIAIKPQLHRGASNVRPITIDEVVLFVPSKGCQVRTINYQLQKDGWTGTDVTVFAAHLFKGRSIVEMAWIDYPQQTVFVVLDDGTMACLVWMIEQEVWGWTLWENRRAALTDAGPHDQIESVCAVLEGGVDRLYMQVRRYVPGHGYHRYVERLSAETWEELEDAAYLDCSTVYAGDPADVISNLDHLEGRAVQALADGFVVDGLTVVGGQITLPAEASKVRVGLRYDTLIHTLPPKVQGSQNRKLNISRVSVAVEDAKGFSLGTAGGQSNPRTVETYAPPLPVTTPPGSQPTPLYTGQVEVPLYTSTWDADLGIVMRSTEPLPFTLLGVFPEVSVGG